MHNKKSVRRERCPRVYPKSVCHSSRQPCKQPLNKTHGIRTLHLPAVLVFLNKQLHIRSSVTHSTFQRHRPLMVAVESLLVIEGPALFASVMSLGNWFGWSGILVISRFASSQASRFYQASQSAWLSATQRSKVVVKSDILSYTSHDDFSPSR